MFAPGLTSHNAPWHTVSYLREFKRQARRTIDNILRLGPCRRHERQNVHYWVPSVVQYSPCMLDIFETEYTCNLHVRGGIHRSKYSGSAVSMATTDARLYAYAANSADSHVHQHGYNLERQNTSPITRREYIDLQHHFLHAKVAKWRRRVVHVPSHEMLAYALTKPLKRGPFQQLVNCMNVRKTITRPKPIHAQ